MNNHPCWQSAVHESGHLLYLRQHPDWLAWFGPYVRVTIYLPGIAVTVGQKKPFTDKRESWISLSSDGPAIDRELALVEIDRELALIAARSLLAGFAAEFVDRDEVPDSDLPFAMYGDKVLQPDFQRAVNIRMKLDDPTGIYSVKAYSDARCWAVNELKQQITALQGDGIAAVRRCANAILSNGRTLSWSEAVKAFDDNKPKQLKAPQTILRYISATLTGGLNNLRSGFRRPWSGMVKFLAGIRRIVCRAEGNNENDNSK